MLQNAPRSEDPEETVIRSLTCDGSVMDGGDFHKKSVSCAVPCAVCVHVLIAQYRASYYWSRIHLNKRGRRTDSQMEPRGAGHNHCRNSCFRFETMRFRKISASVPRIKPISGLAKKVPKAVIAMTGRQDGSASIRRRLNASSTDTIKRSAPSVAAGMEVRAICLN